MYIRTKDGVYDTNKHHYEIEIDVLYEIVWDDTYTEYGVNGKYSRGKVIAQSENLEELCDEFVLYDNQLKTYGVFDKKVITFKWIQNHSTIYKGMTIYGAIWTDKGLIYVAKMNQKGELELL